MALTLLQAAGLLAPGVALELFDVDLTSLNGPELFLHNSVSVGSQSVAWQGATYVAFPIDADGFETNGNGQYPEPKLRVNNLDGVVQALCLNYRGLLGATVRRHRTLFAYTDGQPQADGTQEWVDEFVINQKSADNGPVIEFTLAALPDTRRKLPAGFVSAHYCQWLYRDGNCPYAGSALFDRMNNPIPWTTDRGAFNLTTTYASGDKVYVAVRGVRSYYVAQGASVNIYPALNPTLWKRDTCAKTIPACKCRFGANAVLPADLYPATARLGG